MIIYDNACRPHTYCLNQEPEFFQNTRFLVDQLHWRGHVGCSRSYCHDVYTDRKVKVINSLVYEQANSVVQKICGQLAYMSIDNYKLHCALFLALKDIDKMCKLSLCCLTL